MKTPEELAALKRRIADGEYPTADAIDGTIDLLADLWVLAAPSGRYLAWWHSGLCESRDDALVCDSEAEARTVAQSYPRVHLIPVRYFQPELNVLACEVQP
jgi:hypothetical protein